MIIVECRNGSCRARNSLKNTICRTCGHPLSKQNRVYWVSYRLPNGKRKTERLGLVGIPLAKEMELKRIREATEARYNPPVTPINFWKGVCMPYLLKLELEGKSDNLLQGARYTLKMFSKSFGEVEARQITPQMIEAYRLERLKSVKKSSINREISTAKAAFNYMLPDDKNPFSKVKNYRVDNRVMNILTEDEERRLVKAAKDLPMSCYYEMIVVGLSTGLRKQNILKLNRLEVDLYNCLISMKQKGDRRLDIPISSTLAQFLKTIPDNGTPYFWLNPDTGKPYKNFHPNMWKRVKQDAGISRPFRFHDLRHMAATKMLNSDGSLKVAQELLGHANIEMTQRYAHLSRERLRNAVEGIKVIL